MTGSIRTFTDGEFWVKQGFLKNLKNIKNGRCQNQYMQKIQWEIHLSITQEDHEFIVKPLITWVEQNNNFKQRDPWTKEDRAETAWILIEDLKNMFVNDHLKQKQDH